MAFPHDGVKFQPGQSGNPTGPKPGYKHVSTWIQEGMNDPNFVGRYLSSKGRTKKYKGAPAKAIVMAMMHAAMHGDTRAAEWLAKHGWREEYHPPTPMNPVQIYNAVPVATGDEDRAQPAEEKPLEEEA